MITFKCCSCGASYSVRDDEARKEVRCPKCSATISVPTAADVKTINTAATEPTSTSAGTSPVPPSSPELPGTPPARSKEPGIAAMVLGIASFFVVGLLLLVLGHIGWLVFFVALPYCALAFAFSAVGLRRKSAQGMAIAGLVTSCVSLGLMPAGILTLHTFRGARRDVEIMKTNILLRRVVVALERYKTDVRQWPSEDQGLSALVEKPTFEDEEAARRWRGPYMTKTRRDPWNNEMVYRRTEQGDRGYVLFSKGPDACEGTEDDIYPPAGDEEEGFQEPARRAGRCVALRHEAETQCNSLDSGSDAV